MNFQGRRLPAPAREPMSCHSFSPDGSFWFAGFFLRGLCVNHENTQE